jgi:23S rRNA (pseudouridine1915-N3)-methyltransferase
MKVAFWCIGKTEDAYILEGFALYQKRLTNYLSFEYKEILFPKGKKATNAALHQELEKDEILKLLKPNDTLILLDEKGKEFDSTGFSTFMQKMFNESNGSLVFLAGGAYGFHKEIYNRANQTISLSRMTFTHQMVRLIFIEQLYRAMTILKGEPYHH